MLKVWIWKNRRYNAICHVSLTEPEKLVVYGQPDVYSAYDDIGVCSKHIRRLTGRAPTLKPRVYWLTGQDEHGP